jgi:uncharacterized membrane protein (GlpM family)
MEFANPALMNQLVLKIIVSAFIVGAVSLVSKTFPYLSGYLVAFPIVMLLTLLILVAGKHTQPDVTTSISNFVMGALTGTLLTSLTLLVILLLLRNGLPTALTVALGGVTWFLLAFLISKLTSFH